MKNKILMYRDKKKTRFWIATTRFNNETLRNRRWVDNISNRMEMYL